MFFETNTVIIQIISKKNGFLMNWQFFFLRKTLFIKINEQKVTMNSDVHLRGSKSKYEKKRINKIPGISVRLIPQRHHQTLTIICQREKAIFPTPPTSTFRTDELNSFPLLL